MGDWGDRIVDAQRNAQPCACGQCTPPCTGARIAGSRLCAPCDRGAHAVPIWNAGA